MDEKKRSNKPPQNWVLTDLGEIAEINPSFTQEGITNDVKVSFIPMKSVEELTGHIDLSTTKKLSDVKKGYTPFVEDDLLFAKITPCMENGKVAIARGLTNGIGFGSTEFHVIRLHKSISREFFFFLLIQEGFRRDARTNMTGSAGQLRVPVSYIRDVNLPLPPVPEQYRIVARIEELFTKVDAAVEVFKKIKTQLKRYRQAVLKSAFEGKLTAEWRNAHQDMLSKSSKSLIATIQNKTKKIRHKLKSFDPFEVLDSKLLPNSWLFLTLDYLASSEKNSIKRGPFGSSIKKEFFVPDGYKVYEQGNVIYNDFKRGSYFIDEEKFEEMKAFQVKSGDVLMSCSGTVGKVAVAPEGIQPGIINQALLKITPDNNVVTTSYFVYLFRSKISEIILENTRGTAMVNISSVKDIKQVLFAVPPKAEQDKIVDEIECRLSVVEEVEKAIWLGLKQAERLRQSILKKAFEGKLVPQDPSDEPAEKLLERIKAEKTKQEKDKKIKKSPKRKVRSRVRR